MMAAPLFLDSAGDVISGNMSSFAVLDGPAAAEISASEWRSALTRLGGLDDARAEAIATKFVSHNFPFPSPELLPALTHDFLERLGMTDAGDRVRIILAVGRSAPAPKVVEESSDWKDGVSAGLQERPAGFKTDTEVCEVFSMKPNSKIFEWQEVVGKNPDPEAYHRLTVDPLSTHFEQRRSFRRSRHHQPPVDALSHRRPSAELPCPPRPCQPHETPEDGTLNRTLASQVSARGKKYDVNEPFDIFSAPRPLPVFLVSPDDDRFSSFVLRVPTPEVDFSEATISSLTNKWIVIVDWNTDSIATVHRLDSAALAVLRRQRVTLDGMVTSRVLMSIFIAFIADFNAVLDECVEVLDECEVKLLEPSAARWLIEHLVQLQRRASVYSRLVMLNQSLIRRVATHYDLRDANELDQRWIQLRERTTSLESRSSVLLSLVLSLSGQRTTDVMTVLTKFSICMAPLTLVTGIYGMNFDNMPELRYENSYYIVLSAFALIIVGMLLWMKYVGL